jgi:transcriptional regulator with XRE-family HTH domain
MKVLHFMFKDRLKEAMKKTGYTQQKLATKIGVDQGTISHYVRGVSEPDINRVAEIGDALGINLNWLLLGKGEMLVEAIEKIIDQRVETEKKQLLKEKARAESEDKVLQREIENLDKEEQELLLRFLAKRRPLTTL